MTAPTLDLTIDQGTSFEKLIQWKDAGKTPYDLTGCVALMQVRTTADAQEILLELSTENNRIKLSQGEGKLLLIFDAAATTPLTFESAVYDLLVKFPTGVIRRVVQGAFTLSQGVTKWPTP